MCESHLSLEMQNPIVIPPSVAMCAAMWAGKQISQTENLEQKASPVSPYRDHPKLNEKEAWEGVTGRTCPLGFLLEWLLVTHLTGRKDFNTARVTLMGPGHL